MVHVMFYTPGFMAILLLKTGEPASFGISVELLMLSSAAAIVAGLFIGTQSSDEGADHSSRVGTWCGSLVLELLAAVPFLCAVPPLFHELAHSTLLHTKAPAAVDVTLGASELLPAVAILPFMLYQLAGFGTLHFIVRKPVNWVINTTILGLIIAACVAMYQMFVDVTFLNESIFGMLHRARGTLGDANPFGVKTNLRAVLTGSLTHMAQAIG
jgi:hypothetical protein